jgi:hypothetical protein
MRGERVLYASARTAGSTARDTWRTPPAIIAVAREIFDGSIALDPCADADPASWFADTNYAGTAVTGSGLTQPWRDQSFINMPYSQARRWAEKLVREVEAGRCGEAIVLMPARTDTRAWRLITRYSAAICFVFGRLRFVGGAHAASFASALIYIGEDATRFCAQAPRVGGEIWRKEAARAGAQLDAASGQGAAVCTWSDGHDSNPSTNT